MSVSNGWCKDAKRVDPRRDDKILAPILDHTPITNHTKFLDFERKNVPPMYIIAYDRQIGPRQLSHLKFCSKFNTMNKILKKLTFAIFSLSSRRNNIHPHIQPPLIS